MDISTPSEVPRYANRPNCWTQSRVDQVLLDVGNLCAMHPVAPALWKILSSKDAAQPEMPPFSLREVCKLWGYDWMWNDL